MSVVSSKLKDTPVLPTQTQPTTILIGNFDGVHLGHQALIKQAKSKAEEQGSKLIVLTFFPHPKMLFQKIEQDFLLTSSRLKQSLLEECGVEEMVEFPFDQGGSEMSAECFIEDIIVNALKAKHVFVGEDFKFGKARSGDVRLLQDFGIKHGFEVCPLMLKTQEESPISSTRIRETLRAGKIEEANALLGWQWGFEAVTLTAQKSLPQKEGGKARLYALGVEAEKIQLPLGGYQAQALRIFMGLDQDMRNPTGMLFLRKTGEKRNIALMMAGDKTEHEDGLDKERQVLYIYPKSKQM